MPIWLTTYFLNPAFVLPGLALIAAPIIIHLINRLRFKRVKFAAMEFLLQSEQRNRKRILFEQLLLLLLRILAILLIVALLARLVLSAQSLTMFEGAKSHHVVLLDDSLSMQDRWGDTSALDEAKDVINRLVTEGARRPGTQQFTLLRLSRPDETFANLSERDIDESLIQEVAGKLENLTATHQQVDLLAGLEAARERLSEERAAARHVHLLSDFRQSDWSDAGAIGELVRTMSQNDILVNFVRTVPGDHDNVAVTELRGDVEVAAAGVPVPLETTVANLGSREASQVRLAVAVDGKRLPMNLVFDNIPAGESADRKFSVVFDKPGQHRVVVSLDADALEPDNFRYLAINVPAENPVLIIDGDPSGAIAQYVADALSADSSVTGFSAIINGIDYLRQYPLERFQSIYLVNVPELPPDAVAPLEKFVAAGGGLAWFLGDAVNPAFYNNRLYREGGGLFPGPLASAPAELEHTPGTTLPDLVVDDHPIFRILTGQENPFIDAVLINDYYPMQEEWRQTVLPDSPDVDVIARLRNQQPLMLEHRYGEGRIVTCLTAAGPLLDANSNEWNNWAGGPAAPSYAVVQLELQKYIARRDRMLEQATAGEPIVRTLNPGYYREDIAIITPDDQAQRLKAELTSDNQNSAGDEEGTATSTPMLHAMFADTDAPGVYAVRLTSQADQVEESLVAYNVPTEESGLARATEEQLRRSLGDANVTIQPAGRFDWIQSEEAGQDVRWWLLLVLIGVLVVEQWLAYRLSYHRTEAVG